jgi:hypothetical protein
MLDAGLVSLWSCESSSVPACILDAAAAVTAALQMHNLIPSLLAGGLAYTHSMTQHFNVS